MALRDEAAVYVGVVLDDVLATAGMGRDEAGVPLINLDVMGQLKEPLDATDSAMAFVTIPETDALGREAAYNQLAEYFTLLRVRRKIALRFDVSTGGDSYRLSQSQAQVGQLIEEARLRAVFLAGDAAVSGGIGAEAVMSGPGIGVIELDWSGGTVLTDEYANWASRW